ncbi:hypothetical protein FD754_009801 [Muntiacus muntjak]|uniref:Rho GTPase-activating protein 27 n=1 Tax=Muntiacus muntjak TaxID=9888 RepID=A0A5N3WXY0_MUNMU|nr:hypothetical protein FD754_009801 [Muntiacus muntjak]
MAADVEGDVYVLVEHPFEYTGKDGRRVAIQPNERYRLLRRSTEHWWHVRSEPGGRPFYLPAQYVRELPALGHPAPAPPPPAPLQGPAAPEPLAYDYRFVSASAPAEPDGAPAEPRGRAGSLCGRARPGAATQRRSLAPGSPACLYTRPAAPVRPAQSLDDLARTAAPPAGLLGSGGSFKACSVAGSWVCPRPLARSDSENVYEAIRDVRGPPTEQRPEQPPTPETDYPDLLASYPEEDYSPVGSLSETGPASPFVTPPGWSRHVSPDGQTVYTNNITEEQWVRLENQHGKPYFYNPDDASVQWTLPQVPVPVPAPRNIHKSNQNSETPAQASPPEEKVREGAFVPGSELDKAGGWKDVYPAAGASLGASTPTTGQIKTLDKAGVLHRTKIVDKGKRLRKKHWSASWTVLEGGVLTFFKDSKNSAAGGLRQPSKFSTPEFTVDLKGASLAWAPKDKSSKKNVLELRTRDGSEYLIQHDSEAIISTWHTAITQGIQEMSADLPPEEESESSGVDFGSSERLGSWREDEPRPGAAPPTPGPGGLESDISKVRQKLRKFLLRRPTLQSLREKGYIKDQVFGCPLAELCEREKSPVPRFVQQSIRAVEARGLDIDGLYRISGNLATIQKLRHRVDHDEHLDLEDGRWEDVHVITGALKLFFRELPEPLFPFSHFRQFLAAIKLQDPAKRFRCVRDLVRSLPAPNHDTLRALFQHLCRVIEHGERNRMSVQNVAIVFGPTLLRPETEEASMPMTMVFQNQVVELILQQCSDIFPPP